MSNANIHTLITERSGNPGKGQSRFPLTIDVPPYTPYDLAGDTKRRFASHLARTRALIMAHQHLPDLEHDIIRILQQRGKAYLTVRQVVASLRTRVRQQLGLTRSQATAELLKKMTPLLGTSLQVYRGSRSVYIGQKQSPAEFILHRVQQSPGLSPKQLGLGLPLPKHSYIATLNMLLEAGTLVCTFKDPHLPVLHISRHTPPQEMAPANGGNERAAFQTAYNEVGHGRSFVRIHRLRDALPWARERFERVLQALVADYTIELHGGDPSVMTAEELHQSFTAADGTLYIALSWRGNT